MREPAVFCENLRPQSPWISRVNRKSATVSEDLRNCSISPFLVSHIWSALSGVSLMQSSSMTPCPFTCYIPISRVRGGFVAQTGAWRVLGGSHVPLLSETQNLGAQRSLWIRDWLSDACLRLACCLGNRRTVLRLLFRKGHLTEFCGKLGELCKTNLVSSFWHTNNTLRETH